MFGLSYELYEMQQALDEANKIMERERESRQFAATMQNQAACALDFNQGVFVNFDPLHQGVFVNFDPLHQGVFVNFDPLHQGVFVNFDPLPEQRQAALAQFSPPSNQQITEAKLDRIADLLEQILAKLSR